MHVPCCRHVPCGQPTALAGLTQTVRTFVADGSVEGVAGFPRIGCGSEESHVATITIGHVVVFRTFFLRLLEIAIVETAGVTIFILVTDTVVERTVALDVGNFHTAEKIDDVVVVIDVVVAGRGANAPRIHAVACFAVETTNGQHRNRE